MEHTRTGSSNSRKVAEDWAKKVFPTVVGTRGVEHLSGQKSAAIGSVKIGWKT
jgi:hypothetical protein